MLVPRGFPPIDDQGALMSGEKTNTELPGELVAEGIRLWDSRFVVQNNGLSAVRAWQGVAEASGRVTAGYQMIGRATGDRECKMNGGERPCDPRAVLHEAANHGLDSAP